jgi:hypothetical protein
MSGATVTVKVAHVRLCHSRMMFARAYPRESQEMVFRCALTPLYSVMIAATALGLFAIPLLYIVFQWLRSWRWHNVLRAQRRSVDHP